MKEGDKKKIYYELSKHSVSREKRLTNRIDYTFGNYRLQVYSDRIFVSKRNPINQVFVVIRDASWSSSIPQNATYEIYIAVKNKYENKEYIDPYKNLSTNDIIKDSANRFDKIFTEYAADIFPYDMPEQQYVKTVAELKDILSQKLRKHYTK